MIQENIDVDLLVLVKPSFSYCRNSIDRMDWVHDCREPSLEEKILIINKVLNKVRLPRLKRLTLVEDALLYDVKPSTYARSRYDHLLKKKSTHDAFPEAYKIPQDIYKLIKKSKIEDPFLFS